MSQRRQLHIILHGAIVPMIGLLCGLPFGSAAGGVMLIAIAAILPRLTIVGAYAGLQRRGRRSA
jgi:hypothetical protein